MIAIYKNGVHYATVKRYTKLPHVVGLPLSIRDKINSYLANDTNVNSFEQWHWKILTKIAA
jgi:hypothetical protein